MQSRRIIRPLIASYYAIDGFNSVIHADDHTEVTASFLTRIRTFLPSKYAKKLPTTAQDLTTMNEFFGLGRIGAAMILASGKLPRCAAFSLACLSLPTILGHSAFWETQDPKEQERLRSSFAENIALLGGLLTIALNSDNK